MGDIVILHVDVLGRDDSDPQTLRIQYDVCWPDLECMMKVNYDCKDVVIKYVDEDDDQIIVSSDIELKEALKVAKRNNNNLHVVIRCIDTVSNVPPDHDYDEKMNPVDDTSKTEIKSTEQSKSTVPIWQQEKKQPDVIKDADVSVVTRDEETGAVLTKDYCKRVSSEPLGDPLSMSRETGEKHTLSQQNKQESLFEEKAVSHENLSYQELVQLLEQLKHELKTEIVKEVTRKTVQQVLDGLDGAVIKSIHGTSGLPGPLSSTATDSTSHSIHWHEGIICDNCSRVIVGARYKCGNCLDYDLCEQCESLSGIHKPGHVFLKFRRPCPRVGMINNKMVPLLKRVLYTPLGGQPMSSEAGDTLECDYIPEELRRHPKFEKLQEKMAKMIRKKEEKLVEKQKRKEEKMKRKFEQQGLLPMKKERLDLAELKNSFRCEFVCDVTIPDGSCILPGEKLIKTWRMKNTGKATWTDRTVLRLKWGNITPLRTEVTVPFLKPGEEGNVTVEMIAPKEPGKYHSHWRMFDSYITFGPRVWCSIIVKPKELLEPSSDSSTLKLVEEHNSQKEAAVDWKRGSTGTNLGIVDSGTVDKTLSTAVAAMAQLKFDQPTTGHLEQDLLSFEMLNLSERCPPKASQTATPNNTPLDVSPPKSPTPEMEPLHMSNSSSVELVPDGFDEEGLVTEYVQKKMASLDLKPDVEVDVESLSTISDDNSSLSDNDFYIVPLPDCFDTSKPLTQSTASKQRLESLYDDNHNTINSGTSGVATSLDELLSTSSDITTPPLHPTVSPLPDSPAVVHSPTEEVQMEEMTDAAPCGSNNLQQQALQENKAPQEQINADCAAAAGGCVESTQQVLPSLQGDNHQQLEPPAGAGAGDVAPQHPIIHRLDINAAQADKRDQQQMDSLPSSPTDFANQLMTTAVNAATRAAAQAYSTARDVFYSLQARPAEFQQPGQPSVRAENVWKPSAQLQQWPKPKELTPLNQLLEMGFGNRQLNKALLEKHENDIEKVVQHLLQEENDDWANKRH